MKVVIFTIVLDGMPCITWHLPVFNRLRCDWEWRIVHGLANNVNDTSWCRHLGPGGLSTDGTTEYLNTLRGHPRIKIYEDKLWPGKVAMCNAAIDDLDEPCILLQVDADELWTAEDIDLVERMFHADLNKNCARFFMRFFVGENIVTVGENCYGNNPGEWLRAWRFSPGMKFIKHEPPTLGPMAEVPFIREETRNAGIVPDHYAYVFEHQVAFKEAYYGYRDALKHWQRLQTHAGRWPVRLKDFLPWVDDRVISDLLHKPNREMWPRNPGDGQP